MTKQLDAGELNKMLFLNKNIKVSLRNKMLFLLLVEINGLHDSVYMFNEKEKESELFRLKKYLNNKLNLD